MKRLVSTANTMSPIFILLIITASFSLLGGEKVVAQEDPAWNWTPEKIKATINTVRAGRDLSPKTWPGGAKVAVSLSFDIDTEMVWMGFQRRMTAWE